MLAKCCALLRFGDALFPYMNPKLLESQVIKIESKRYSIWN